MVRRVARVAVPDRARVVAKAAGAAWTRVRSRTLRVAPSPVALVLLWPTFVDAAAALCGLLLFAASEPLGASALDLLLRRLGLGA